MHAGGRGLVDERVVSVVDVLVCAVSVSARTELQRLARGDRAERPSALSSMYPPRALSSMYTSRGPSGHRARQPLTGGSGAPSPLLVLRQVDISEEGREIFNFGINVSLSLRESMIALFRR